MPLALAPPSISIGEGSYDKILPGSGLSVPAGVDGVITFNNLTINNRRWLDTIVIEKIDGLGDADVRDERENNPQSDGETAFDAFYGGRTIVLSGFIRAFTLDKLRDITTAIKSAFLPLEELPMVFHGRDFASTCQIYCRKFAPLVESEEQTRDDMFRRDIMITVRASNPNFISLDHPLVSETFGAADNFSSDSTADYEEL